MPINLTREQQEKLCSLVFHLLIFQQDAVYSPAEHRIVKDCLHTLGTAWALAAVPDVCPQVIEHFFKHQFEQDFNSLLAARGRQRGGGR